MIQLTVTYPAYYGHENPDKGFTLTADSYEEMTTKLVDYDQAHTSHTIDGYEAIFYWADPDAIDLDEDEEEPEKPNYTASLVEDFARHVFDTSHVMVIEAPVLTTDFELAQRLVTDLDITEDAARNAVEEFISQCETLDGIPYDRDGLTEEQEEFVYGSVKAWLGTDMNADAALEEVDRITQQLQKTQTEMDFISNLRDQAVVRALNAGATVVDTAAAAGLSRKGIYVIRDRATK